MDILRKISKLMPTFGLCLLLVWGIGCDSNDEPQEELTFEELVVGAGAPAGGNQIATVDYVGMLENGTIFDSSYPQGRDPLEVHLDTGRLTSGVALIEGFAQGIIGMKVGGKRRVNIPPRLAYGNQGVGCDLNGQNCRIPPNSTVVFDIELLETQNP